MKQAVDISLNGYVKKYNVSHRVRTNKTTFVGVNNDLKTYCSIQIIANENNLTAPKVAERYFHWLTQTSKSVIKAKFQNHSYKLYFRLLDEPLLVLSMLKKDDVETIFSVTGGLLAKANQKGTFTFKTAEDNYCIVALEEFESSLPWFFYRLTQAPIHEFVMKRFQKEKG